MRQMKEWGDQELYDDASKVRVVSTVSKVKRDERYANIEKGVDKSHYQVNKESDDLSCIQLQDPLLSDAPTHLQGRSES